MMWWSNGWGGAAWFGFAMMHLLFWVALVAGVIMLLRPRGGQRGAPPSEQDRAVTILRERYARGEIDRQEFEEKLQVLKGP